MLILFINCFLKIYYDVYFALRLCQEKKRNKACVKLSAILELWEYAIDLALEDKDLELAQQVANMPQQSDVELRKKLWLKIGTVDFRLIPLIFKISF